MLLLFQGAAMCLIVFAIIVTIEDDTGVLILLLRIVGYNSVDDLHAQMVKLINSSEGFHAEPRRSEESAEYHYGISFP
jgi:hypothetical protein